MPPFRSLVLMGEPAESEAALRRGLELPLPPRTRAGFLYGLAMLYTRCRFLAAELIPSVEREYSVVPGRDGRALLGFSSGADAVVDMALLYGGEFDRAYAQSPGWMKLTADRRHESLLADSAQRFAQWTPGPVPALRLAWGDDTADAWESDARANGETVVALLRSRGLSVETDTLAGGHTLATLQRGWLAAADFLLPRSRHPSR